MDEALSPERTRGLEALLDTLIPPSADGALPGAGEVGLAMVLAEQAPELAPLIEGALTALDARAAERGAAGFADLRPEDRAELLVAHAETDPTLLPGLLFRTYTSYYQQRDVILALGLEHRPPHPEGYTLEPTDPARLDGVRQRPRLYREA